MNETRIEKNLSLLPWTNTRSALNNLQELLKCNGCQQLPASPQYLGRCDHFFCESCITKLADNFCPICKIPSPPCERKPDIIVRGLVSSVTELLALVNGGEVQMKKQGLEAPETCNNVSFSHKPPINKMTNFTTRSTTNKENVLGASESNPGTSGRRPASNNIFEVPKPKGKQPRVSKKIVKKIDEPISNNNNNNRECFSHVNSNKKRANDPLSSPRPDTSKVNETPATPKNLPNAKPQDLSILGVSPITPNVNKRNMKGETPLHIACIKRDAAKLKELLEDGANPNTKDNAGWTPLHEACSHGFEDIATLLLEHGALVDVPGNNNMTPLHDAIMTETIPVISLLRRWGASDTVRDIWGRTARSLADLTKSPTEIHSALDTPNDALLIPKNALGPLQNKIVILDSSLTSDYKKKLERVAKLLKIKLVNDFSADVTHIVVGCDEKKKVCQRTIKYMMGVVAGKWILSNKWLDACLSVGGPVSPQDYEVEGPRGNPCALAPSKGRLNASKMFPGLFSGCHLFFCGPYAEHLPTKKELEALVKAGDGICLQREPNPESIDEAEQTVPYHTPTDGSLAKCSHFCVYATGLRPQLMYDMVHIKTLSLSWLYDCIDHWCLIPPVK